MFKVFYPYEYAESVFSIDYNKLYSKGYRGVIFDIDNTLVHHGEDSTPEVDELFQIIHRAGLKTLLLSNNDEERIQRFLKNIDSLYICDADKPHTANYLKAVKMLHIKKKEAVFIGDQIFTDIYGANRSGIDNILVKYLRYDDETKIGIRRNLEKIILKLYSLNKSCQHRIGDIYKKEAVKEMPAKKKKLFCEINPVCYAISSQKEILKRHLKDFFGHEKFAKTIQNQALPNVVSSHSSNMIKRAKGVDLRLQKNKATNIILACRKMNGIIIHPGEVFSFWRTVGQTSRRKGYKDGRVISGDKLIPGPGGGLCNLANTIHLLVLHSPLEVTEFHKHSDALAPDQGKRVPFSSGTSVSYNYIDYRFRNNTNQNVQLLLWCEGETLHAELRSEYEFPWCYRLVEENHHFRKEGNKYYRVSKIYKEITERATGKILEKKLILDNHSEVMYDYSLIPQELIRE